MPAGEANVRQRLRICHGGRQSPPLRSQWHLSSSHLQRRQGLSLPQPKNDRPCCSTGERKTIQVPKRIKPWWFDSNGKTCIAIHYGAKVLTLGGKGQTAIELAGDTELVPTFELIKQAVEVGELDAQLQVVSGAAKANFKK
ncbi:MAG: DUF6641 family protein [Candidatus Accumulibacter necessarius]|jgi:hypothetical protein